METKEIKLSHHFSVQIPEHVASWHEEGKKAGKKVFDMLEKGETLMREYVLVFADYLAEMEGDHLAPAAMDWINGFCGVWSNPNTQKSRKTDLKAVFDAIAIKGDDLWELVVGHQETKDEAGKAHKVEVKETRTVREWLLCHQEVPKYQHWKGLTEMARMFRGPASGRGAGGGKTKGFRTVTDTQQAEIEGRIEVMTPKQAHAVAQRSLNQLAKLPGFEVVQFRLIVAACDQILNKSGDQGCKNRAQAIRDQAEDMVDRILHAEKEKGGIVSTPAPKPATAPAPIAETSVQPPKQEAA